MSQFSEVDSNTPDESAGADHCGYPVRRAIRRRRRWYHDYEELAEPRPTRLRSLRKLPSKVFIRTRIITAMTEDERLFMYIGLLVAYAL